MNRTFTSLVAGAALLVGAGSAQAITISGGSASLSSTLTDYNTDLVGTLTKFDTTLGTLNSITFTYSFGFNSIITVQAVTAASGGTRTESAAAFSSSDSNVKAVLDALINTSSATIGAQTLVPSAYDLLGTTRTYNQAAGTTSTYNSNVALNSSTAVATGSQLLPFEAAGGGTFVVSANTLTGTVGSTTGGNAIITQQTYANQSISVSYDYTAAPPPVGVPEPASMALFGFGLLGAGLARRYFS